MPPDLHPLARASLANVTLMDPIVRYQPGVTERIFTNTFAPDYGLYPNPVPIDLQQRYAAYIDARLPTRGATPASAPALHGAQVLFTPGSTVSIDLLVRAFCDPGVDRICIVPPAFPAYQHYAKAYAVGIREVPASPPLFDDVDVEAVCAAPSKLTFLCRPAWPHGTMFDLDRIEAIATRAAGVVAVDEAYIDFADGSSAVSLVHRCRNLVVMRTLSKAWGLAGARVGTIIGDERLLHPVRLLLDPFSFHVAAQQAVASRLDRAEWLRDVTRLIIRERERVASVAASLPSVRGVFPSHANFQCLALHDPLPFLQQAEQERLLVRDVSRWLPQTVRISIADIDHNDRVLALLARDRSSTPAPAAAAADTPASLAHVR